MEYNELIEKIQQQPVGTPDTDAILAGMRRKMHRSRQRRAIVAAACLLLAIVPLALPVADTPKPTLAETVSATLPSSPDDLPAPLTGYRNSIRNHQSKTLI